MKKILTGLGLILLLIVIVVVVRAALHTPSEGDEVTPVSIDVDVAGAADRVAQAVRFRTVSNQRVENFPEAEFDAFVAWLEETYSEAFAAAPAQKLAGHTLLLRWQGTNATLAPILLTGHYDVVPVIPGSEGDWQHPPYAGEIVDGIIWGRGALDDKSAVIAQLEALTKLVQEGFQPARTVYFSFGHDEEVGGSGAAAVTAHLAEQGVQLAWSLDEGSFLFDGLLPGLSNLFGSINVAEKGSVTIQIVAHGAGGHSSMPPKDYAVNRLAHALTALQANPLPGGLSGLSEQMFDAASRHMSFAYRVPFANRWLFDGMLDSQLSAVTFGNAMLRTTIAPTMLSGSIKTNVLPTEAVATVNFRIHPRDTVESVVEHVRSVVESEHVEVRHQPNSGRNPSKVSSWDSAGFQIVSTATREVFEGAAIAPGLMIAASDTRHYSKVADDSFRFNPMVVTQEDLTGFHGTNEKISVGNLAQGVRAYYRTLQLGTAEY